MRFVLVCLFLILPFAAPCQTTEEVDSLWMARSYRKAIIAAKKLVDSPVIIKELYHTIGRIYMDIDRYDSAIVYLQRSLQLDSGKTYISGWSYACLGEAHIKTGEKHIGIIELNTCIELRKTRNSVQYALKVLNAPHADMKFATAETEHIVFKFQDTTGWGKNVNRYIRQHEQAYGEISEVFQPVLPRKIIFYVWSDLALAKEILGKDLGFASPETQTCQVHRNQTLGHEMTHVLSYWGWGTATVKDSTTRFINEGVAVAFDLSGRNRYETAKNAVAGKNIHTVMDVWKNDHEADAAMLYPLAGAFVIYLYKTSTPEQFKSVIKNQTIYNAEQTYGKARFDELIAAFDKEVGLH